MSTFIIFSQACQQQLENTTAETVTIHKFVSKQAECCRVGYFLTYMLNFVKIWSDSCCALLRSRPEIPPITDCCISGWTSFRQIHCNRRLKDARVYAGFCTSKSDMKRTSNINTTPKRHQ
eukprot:4090929-Amphidinium_carterae.1